MWPYYTGTPVEQYTPVPCQNPHNLPPQEITYTFDYSFELHRIADALERIAAELERPRGEA